MTSGAEPSSVDHADAVIVVIPRLMSALTSIANLLIRLQSRAFVTRASRAAAGMRLCKNVRASIAISCALYTRVECNKTV
jgi:hypothetical protein